MGRILLFVLILMLLIGCSADNDEKVKEVEEENTVTQANTSIDQDDNVQVENMSEPVDLEKSVEIWDEEIEKWYKSSSMGAIEVIPVKEDYTHLNVIIHNNIQPLGEEGRNFIADDIEGDLQELVKEIFEYEGEVQVDFEFQDGSPLLDE